MVERGDLDEQSKHFREFSESNSEEWLPFIRKTGLQKGIGPFTPQDEIDSFDLRFHDVQNEFAIFINARDRKLTLFEALHNLLTLKIRRDAYRHGFNSKLT